MNFFSDCEITEKGVRIRVLFFSRTIAFGKIKSFHQVSFGRLLLAIMSPFNPLTWSTGDISLSGGVILETDHERVLFSPKNCAKFMTELHARMEQAKENEIRQLSMPKDDAIDS